MSLKTLRNWFSKMSSTAKQNQGFQTGGRSLCSNCCKVSQQQHQSITVVISDTQEFYLCGRKPNENIETIFLLYLTSSSLKKKKEKKMIPDKTEKSMKKLDGAKNKNSSSNNQCQRKLGTSTPLEVTYVSKSVLKLVKYG